MNQAYHARHFYKQERSSFFSLCRFPPCCRVLLLQHGTGSSRAPQQASDPSGYRLIGTMEGAPLAGAVISDSTGTQTFYRLHELLPDGSQVIKVRSDSISLKRSDGTSYDLYFRGSSPDGQQNRPPATAAVPPAVVQETRSGLRAATPRDAESR